MLAHRMTGYPSQSRRQLLQSGTDRLQGAVRICMNSALVDIPPNVSQFLPARGLLIRLTSGPKRNSQLNHDLNHVREKPHPR